MEHIKYAQADKVVTITIDRPEKMNALNPAAMKELGECWDTFQADDSAWVALLASTGDRAFCVGMDLSAEMSEGEKEELFEVET